MKMSVVEPVIDNAKSDHVYMQRILQIRWLNAVLHSQNYPPAVIALTDDMTVMSCNVVV